MNRRTLLLLGAALGALLSGLCAQESAKANRAEIALQAAIKREVIDGDLKAAIDQFRKLARDANHSVAAQALLHLGACYEKQGNAEARKVYEQLIAGYADQPETVKAARSRLAAIGGAPEQSGKLLAKQVFSGSFPGYAGPISPDGRTMLATGEEYGELFAVDLASGMTKKLLDGYVIDAEYSPDGTQLAYTWTLETEDAKTPAPDSEIRVGPVDMRSWRVVAKIPKTEDSLPDVSWSPDQKSLLTISSKLVRTDDNRVRYETSKISAYDVASGRVRTIVELPERELTTCLGRGRIWSPDGKWIAFGWCGLEGQSPDVYLVSSEGGVPVAIAKTPARETPLAFTRDGKGLLFVSQRGRGDRELWVQSLEAGKPVGVAKPVLPQLPGEGNLGMSRDGTLYCYGSSSSRSIYELNLEPRSEPRNANLAKVPDSTPAYSPDGKYLAYSAASSHLQIRNLETGSERQAPGGVSVSAVYGWLPNGKDVIIQGQADGVSGFHLMNVDTGAAKVLIDFKKRIGIHSAGLSPDGGKWFYWWSKAKGRLMAMDTATLADTDSPKVPDNVWALAFSPDGKRIALRVWDYVNASLGIMNADGSGFTELGRCAPRQSCFGDLQWAPDGSALYVIRDGADGSSEILRYPSRGGEPLQVYKTRDSLTSLTLHPSGGKVMFGQAHRQDEIWTIEGAGNIRPE